MLWSKRNSVSNNDHISLLPMHKCKLKRNNHPVVQKSCSSERCHENFKAFLCIRGTVSNRSLIVLCLSQFTGVQTFLQVFHFLQKREALVLFPNGTVTFHSSCIIQRDICEKNTVRTIKVSKNEYQSYVHRKYYDECLKNTKTRKYVLRPYLN